MNKALRLALSAAAALIAAPVAASAQNAFTTYDASMRAGPGVEYPRVAVIPEDSSVYIHGCLRGFNWCDVGWRGERGWVNGNLLSYAYGGDYVSVDEWGPRIGLPIISFEVRDYWTRYYRDRPWWERRSRWFEDDMRRRDRETWREEWREEWRQEPRRQLEQQWREERRDTRREAPDRTFQQREERIQRERAPERMQERMQERTQERMQERMQEPRERAQDRAQERAQERVQQRQERAQERAQERQERAQERQERAQERQERRGQ